jgi:hypothetical protein
MPVRAEGVNAKFTPPMERAGRRAGQTHLKIHQKQPKSNSHLTQKVQKAQETQAPEEDFIDLSLPSACLKNSQRRLGRDASPYRASYSPVW